MSRKEVWLEKHHEALLNAQLQRYPQVVSKHEIAALVPDDAATAELMDGFVQKALLTVMKQKLDADPLLNRSFQAQVKNPLLQQLLVGARIKELAKARIVKKGGKKQLRYDVSDLAQTFYGQQLLESVGLKRQRVLDKDELEKLLAACEKVKLKLPEAIEPTTTERFFDDVPKGGT